MKCPHCLVDFHDVATALSVGIDVMGGWVLRRRHCPSCKRYILHLENGDLLAAGSTEQNVGLAYVDRKLMVWPQGVSRAPIPPEVPLAIAEDYKEACLVLFYSPKASAALTRRCLQNLLRQAAAVKPGDLRDEIQQVIDSGKLPSAIAEGIDAVRNIGNFAAHPNKSKSTGEVVPVEPDEAEWNLDVLESLFDFYFVQPALSAKRKAELNRKLKEAVKPQIK